MRHLNRAEPRERRGDAIGFLSTAWLRGQLATADQSRGPRLLQAWDPAPPERQAAGPRCPVIRDMSEAPSPRRSENTNCGLKKMKKASFPFLSTPRSLGPITEAPMTQSCSSPGVGSVPRFAEWGVCTPNMHYSPGRLGKRLLLRRACVPNLSLATLGLRIALVLRGTGLQTS